MKLRLSQEDFAERFGLSLRTLQQWEQKRRAPDGPAQQLLRIIAEDPEAVAAIVARLRRS
jgi:putative transcriptional regulator